MKFIDTPYLPKKKASLFIAECNIPQATVITPPYIENLPHSMRRHADLGIVIISAKEGRKIKMFKIVRKKELNEAVTLMDILRENGYYQALMVGSEADFGDRSLYYSSHGVDKIYDINTAQSDGTVPEGYNDGWWGMEDYRLYEYAKQELTKISQQEQPFAFSLLTDTFRNCRIKNSV